MAEHKDTAKPSLPSHPIDARSGTQDLPTDDKETADLHINGDGIYTGGDYERFRQASSLCGVSVSSSHECDVSESGYDTD